MCSGLGSDSCLLSQLTKQQTRLVADRQIVVHKLKSYSCFPTNELILKCQTLTYTSRNVDELFFSQITGSRVEIQTSSVRVQKTVHHYFSDACSVYVCLHGTQRGGASSVLQPITAPCSPARMHHM